MSNEYKVESELRLFLAGLDLGFPIEYHEEALASYPNENIWLKVSRLPSLVENVGIGYNGLERYRGIWQINVNNPRGKLSFKNHYDAVDTILNSFPVGLRISSNPSIQIEGKSSSSPYSLGAYDVIALSIDYRYDNTRNIGV